MYSFMFYGLYFFCGSLLFAAGCAVAYFGIILFLQYKLYKNYYDYLSLELENNGSDAFITPKERTKFILQAMKEKTKLANFFEKEIGNEKLTPQNVDKKKNNFKIYCEEEAV